MIKNAYLTRAVDDLQTRLYTANQRADQFSARLGFSDISQAEAAVAEAPELFHVDNIDSLHDRIQGLEAEKLALENTISTLKMTYAEHTTALHTVRGNNCQPKTRLEIRENSSDLFEGNERANRAVGESPSSDMGGGDLCVAPAFPRNCQPKHLL